MLENSWIIYNRMYYPSVLNKLVDFQLGQLSNSMSYPLVPRFDDIRINLVKCTIILLLLEQIKFEY